MDADGILAGTQFEMATGKCDYLNSGTSFKFSTNQFFVILAASNPPLLHWCDDFERDIFGAIYPELVQIKYIDLHPTVVVRE